MRKIKVKEVFDYIRHFKELKSLLQSEARKQNTLLADNYRNRMKNLDGAIEELESQLQNYPVIIDFERTYCSKFDIF